MLASIRAIPRPGMSSSDISQAKSSARDLYDKVCKVLHLPEAAHLPLNGHESTFTRSQRRLSDDMEMHIEIAKLWFEDDVDRVKRGLQEAFRLSERDNAGGVDPRLVNNLGALQHMAAHFDVARPLYERALMDATSSSTANENASTSILYNLGRLYEDQGHEAMAKDAYEKLLSRHPEYVDGTFPIRVSGHLSKMTTHDSQNPSCQVARRCQPLQRCSRLTEASTGVGEWQSQLASFLHSFPHSVQHA